MKRVNIVAVMLTVVVAVVAIAALGWWLVRREPLLVQGCVECRVYRASSKIAGRIDTMYVVEGQTVRKGELLYTLTTPELATKLLQAEAVRSAAEALDRKALSGARVQQIEAARNLWQKAQAGKTLAERSLLRVRNLHDEGVVPAQKLDEAVANFEAMRATERAAKAEYDLALAGASTEDKQAAAAQVEQAQGVVDEVEAYMRDAMVYAPVSGEVSTIVAESGELVGSGMPVVTILDLDDMHVLFNIKETILPEIRLGVRFVGYVPALNRDVLFEVSYISPQADFATWSATRTRGGFDIRTFAVKAVPVADAEGMRPGMSVVVDWNEIGGLQ
ncbi:MAG: HlyD family efflux transporter periplasmic adaptor subunit [Rikenellaceae bacterium]|nr:HlyD family efflux transporter periplasmic adaptor subunit [Rikenellaceae bacterium]